MRLNFLFYLFLLFSMGLISCGTEKGTGTNPAVTPSISISSIEDFEGNEGVTLFTFEVSLSAKTSVTVEVDYNLEAFTALENEDFESQSGTLTFLPDSDLEILEVKVVADNVSEEDEQFKVILSNPQNATISIGNAVGTIKDDEDFTDNPGDGYITPLEYEGYNLSWNDEFGGDAINLEYWTHELGDSGWGNNELQNYTSSSSNSFIEDGKLVIKAIKESDGSYTSARMITKGKKFFTHARVDIRATVPTAQGIWPALWMLGENIGSVGWPYCGEIDIMELVGFEQSTIHGTAHWGPQGQGFSIYEGSEYSLSNGEKYSEKYHVFTIIWEEDSIKWYMDDNLFHSMNKSTVGDENYPFNQDFFFIFNVAVGGNWPGPPDATTTWPQQMTVDYIRVFQKQ